tara:strand:- start:154 stop:390 length:237 start_codon:yes stop_codon:yes gene_type:complete
MFENISTAIVQAIGFFGVFGYFVFQLLNSKTEKPVKKKLNKKTEPNRKNLSSSGFNFLKKKSVEAEKQKIIKKSWFKR